MPLKSIMFKSLPNLSEMLNSVDLDLVVLCTPSGIHAAQTILAAKSGVNVISKAYGHPL